MSAQTAATSGSPRMISLGFDTEPWPAGTHMCMIFNDDAERRSVIAKFMQSGLDAHEVVSYFVDTLTPEELKKSLGEAGVIIPDEPADSSESSRHKRPTVPTGHSISIACWA